MPSSPNVDMFPAFVGPVDRPDRSSEGGPMACGRRSIPRILAAISKTTLTTALTLICMLALAPAASARVTVEPASVQGGRTETFTVRLSNEQPDLATTRLELTFPTDVVIPLVRSEEHTSELQSPIDISYAV